jgi:hypothetical protein
VDGRELGRGSLVRAVRPGPHVVTLDDPSGRYAPAQRVVRVVSRDTVVVTFRAAP